MRADLARDRRLYLDAAALYGAALHHSPDEPGLLVQAGHMLKESGRLAAAEAHYRRAAPLMLDDPDLALQIGHLMKVAGRLDEAEAAYRRAAGLGAPGARRELEALGCPPDA